MLSFHSVIIRNDNPLWSHTWHEVTSTWKKRIIYDRTQLAELNMFFPKRMPFGNEISLSFPKKCGNGEWRAAAANGSIFLVVATSVTRSPTVDDDGVVCVVKYGVVALSNLAMGLRRRITRFFENPPILRPPPLLSSNIGGRMNRLEAGFLGRGVGGAGEMLASVAWYYQYVEQFNPGQLIELLIFSCSDKTFCIFMIYLYVQRVQ